MTGRFSVWTADVVCVSVSYLKLSPNSNNSSSMVYLNRDLLEFQLCGGSCVAFFATENMSWLRLTLMRCGTITHYDIFRDVFVYNRLVSIFDIVIIDQSSRRNCFAYIPLSMWQSLWNRKIDVDNSVIFFHLIFSCEQVVYFKFFISIFVVTCLCVDILDRHSNCNSVLLLWTEQLICPHF